MTLRSDLVVFLLMPLAACDGVGRALVDQTISTPDSGQGCGQEAICGSMLPELPVPSGAGDFGDFGDFSSCDMPNPVPIVSDSLPMGPCNCLQYEVHLGPGMTTVPWLATSLQHCVLNISADQATSVELPRATLDDVAIKLTGPIALRVRETQLVRVRIRGSATDAGAPSLALETSDAVQLAVKNLPATFDHLSVSHATLADTLLETSSAHFESVAVQRSTIKVADFDAIDVNVSESQLALERALISFPTMNNVKLTDCGSVRFVGGEIFRTESAACSELLQLYSVKVRDSWLDGPLESDLSSFENTSLGNVQKTSLLGYDTSLVRVTLCQGVERLRLSHGYVSCVACDGSLAQDPASVCSESGGVSAELDDSSCAALADVPMCESFPPRRRPI